MYPVSTGPRVTRRSVDGSIGRVRTVAKWELQATLPRSPFRSRRSKQLHYKGSRTLALLGLVPPVVLEFLSNLLYLLPDLFDSGLQLLDDLLALMLLPINQELCQFFFEAYLVAE
jgi:hypothetical protein